MQRGYGYEQVSGGGKVLWRPSEEGGFFFPCFEVVILIDLRKRSLDFLNLSWN